jgi:hypothetical protein
MTRPVLPPATAMPAQEPLREPTCPLCGGANGCVPAATGRFDQTCWCTKAVIDREALARLRAAAKGRACLCARCAGVAARSSPRAP